MRFSEDQIKMDISKLSLPFGWVFSSTPLTWTTARCSSWELENTVLLSIAAYTELLKQSPGSLPVSSNPKPSCGRLSGQKHLHACGGGRKGQKNPTKKPNHHKKIPTQNQTA